LSKEPTCSSSSPEKRKKQNPGDLLSHTLLLICCVFSRHECVTLELVSFAHFFLMFSFFFFSLFCSILSIAVTTTAGIVAIDLRGGVYAVQSATDS